MNKESIYKIIGYNGEYNASVKKAIRKLLKENHPDNHGDRRIFELINEVKKELENNKVPKELFTKKENLKSNDGIDFNYCHEMIKLTTKEKEVYLDLLKTKKNDLRKLEQDYHNLYRKNVDLESDLILCSLDKRKLKSIKIITILLLIVAIVMFAFAVIEKSLLLFISFVFLTILCILVIERYLYNTHKLVNYSHRNLKDYVNMGNEIRKNVKRKEELKKEINNLNKKIINIDNDLRFYNNLLK